MTTKQMNVVGLSSNLCGVIILFLNGLSISQIYAPGHQFYFVNPDQTQQTLHLVRNGLSYLALILIIVGFAFQLAASLKHDQDNQSQGEENK